MHSSSIDILHDVFGHDEFWGHQQQIIEHVAAGGDVLALLPTGGGKSLCFQIPSLMREGVGIVVSPLIALMKDQVDALCKLGVRAAYLNSSQSSEEQRKIREGLEKGNYDLLYVAPERAMMPAFLKALPSMNPALFAIDEAHCVSQWGHSFREDYLDLVELHNACPDVPRIALTATATPDTRDDILEQLDMPNAEVFVTSFDRPNIAYHIVPKADADEQLHHFINTRHKGESGIVYRRTRDACDASAEWLRDRGINAVAYHAGLSDSIRKSRQEMFCIGKGVVVVATVAFGMGIDKSDVRFVCHLDVPQSIEAYYQETGRAGRDGLPSDAWMTYDPDDVDKVRWLIDNDDQSTTKYRRVLKAKLDAMQEFCDSAECRRIELLRYFDEKLAQPCDNCDNCTSGLSRLRGQSASRERIRSRKSRSGAVNLAPKDALAASSSHIRLSRARKGHNKQLTARASEGTTMRLDGPSPSKLSREADHLMAAGDAKAALEQYREAVEAATAVSKSNPMLGHALQGMGRALYELGQIDEAMDALKQSLLHSHDLPTSYYLLAVAYKDRGETVSCLKSLREALRQAPTHRPSLKLLRTFDRPK